MITKVTTVKYREVLPDTYLVYDEDGKITTMDGKIVEQSLTKGYYHVRLLTTIKDKDGNNQYRFYPVHRIVLASFTGDKPKLHVDHVNGNSKINDLSNLEWVTNKENHRRAAELGLYESCEDHYKAIFTNDQVHEICKLFSKGYNVRKVIKELNLEKEGYSRAQLTQCLTQIAHRKSWCNISKYYKWDIDDIRLKKYKKKDLEKIAYLIQFEKKYTYKEIAKMFPEYSFKQLHQVIKKMAQGKLYKSIMKEVERSTTIDAFVDLMMRQGYC